MSVTHAIIMAAGTSSRFVPNALEYPKGLTVVKGEILIERQIKQLQAAGVEQIVIVTGYLAKAFDYLAGDKITLVHNPDYDSHNNHSSLYHARAYLEDCFICSADNYFTHNPFEETGGRSYYSAVYAAGETEEWVMSVDRDDRIQNVTVGGRDGWVMLGQAYFNRDFGRRFRTILEQAYPQPDSRHKFWENLLIEHLNQLEMYIKRYPEGVIYEFDSLDELRQFDESYWEQPQSEILERISRELAYPVQKLHRFRPIRRGNRAIGFRFRRGKKKYVYLAADQRLLRQKKYKKLLRQQTEV